MKIAVILGSPRKQDTYRICKEIESNFLSPNTEFDYIQLSDYTIQECIGCDICFKKSQTLCPCNDDLQGIIKRLEDANGLVFAAPVYAYQVPSTLKKFIDRMSFMFHRPILVGIPAAVIVSSEGGGYNHVLKYLKMTARGWGCHIIGDFNMIAPMYFEEDRSGSAWGFNYKYAQKKKRALRKLSTLLEKALDVQNKKIPTYGNIFMFNCLRSKTYTSQADYDYWKSKGWLDAPYFYDAKIGPLKRLFGRSMKTFIDLASRKIENRIT